MKAIADMKKEFLANFAGILMAIKGVKQDFSEFANRLTVAEKCIGDTENTTLQKNSGLAPETGRLFYH